MTKDTVFISLRFQEAENEAKRLLTAMRKRGHDAYICSVRPGESIKREVSSRLAKAKMVIIMGTKTYGSKGTVDFSTAQELQFIKDEHKPFFLIKMCDKFKEDHTRFTLTSDISYVKWNPGTPMPAGLISELEKKFESC